jgi:hypothetical protein
MIVAAVDAILAAIIIAVVILIVAAIMVLVVDLEMDSAAVVEDLAEAGFGF